jgi:hypothetical protein
MITYYAIEKDNKYLEHTYDDENRARHYWVDVLTPDCLYYNSELAIEYDRKEYGGVIVEVEFLVKSMKYDPQYGFDTLCQCGHTYYRHFDSYEDRLPVSCKYCECTRFIAAE